MKRDEFFGELQKLAKEQDIKRALLIGGDNIARSTEALLAGMSETEARPDVFRIDRLTRRFRRFEKAFAGRVKSHGVQSSSPAEFSRNVADTIKEIKDASHIDAWDAVLIDGSVVTTQHAISPELQRDLRRARLVVFDGINNIGIYANHDRLLADPDYALVAHNPSLRNGYAIFKRIGRLAHDHNRSSPSTSSEGRASGAPAQRSTDTDLADGGPRPTLAEIRVPVAQGD
jgi:hypothetical protein